MSQFGLSVHQPSAYLSRNTFLARINVDHDGRLRTHARQPGCKAVFDKLDGGRCLAHLCLDTDRILNRDDRWIAGLPDYDSAPTPRRGVNPATLRAVVVAIPDAEPIEFQHQSLWRPEPAWRWIAPHAIAFGGILWHARAFCLADRVFKDFLLSRILDIRGSQESSIPPKNDHDWHASAALETGPHPALSKIQAKVIALDYGMRGGKAKIRVRHGLLYYALRHLGLDTGPVARKPQDQQIVLLNRAVIHEDHG